MSKQSSHALTLAFAFLLAGLFLLQFGTFIDRATPSLIDDHDILYPLGDKPTATLQDIWTDLKNTDEYQELATNGAATRFRPAFYVFKSIQTYLWGANIRLWYIANFLMYLGTTTLLFALVLRTFGISSALVFAVLYLGHKSWADIFPRLGPVEIECILVGTVLIWMLWRWIESNDRSALYLSIPTALLFGAMKEANPVLLGAAGGLLLVCGFLAEKKRMMLAGIVLLSTGVIVLIVLLRITVGAASTGLVSPSGPLNSYLSHRGRDPTAWLVVILLGTLAAVGGANRNTALRMSKGELAALALAAISIELMRLTLYYISFSQTYGGYNDAIGLRYGYPLALMQALVAAVVFGRLAAESDRKISARSQATAIACCLALLLVNKGAFAASTLKARDWWLQFNSEADRVVSGAAKRMLEARGANRNPVLIATGPALEWEPKLSLILFLKRKMPDTVVYFDPDEQSANPGHYTNLSIRLGGTPLSPEVRASLPARGCVDVHVDDRAYANPNCDVLNIMMASRPAP
ncbi:hypothetical protein JQ543_03020 [Bradyrhizobium diazoefficiens]|nr:hypothetical protein [Bradyrhizobium diazoefficiens]MBR0846703.1 hypothetical protein [Bradyrhizobium diazoefficiens]